MQHNNWVRLPIELVKRSLSEYVIRQTTHKLYITTEIRIITIHKTIWTNINSNARRTF